MAQGPESDIAQSLGGFWRPARIEPLRGDPPIDAVRIRIIHPTAGRDGGLGPSSFQRFGVEGVPAGRVVEELGLSENALILAKSRDLKRSTEEAGDLLW